MTPPINLHQLEFLSIAMERFSDKSDAWRDFTVDCNERLNISPHGGPSSIVIPGDIWEYWLSMMAERAKARITHVKGSHPSMIQHPEAAVSAIMAADKATEIVAIAK
jgi:hypothetical protein